MMEVKMFAESVAEQIKNYLPEHLQEGECRVMEMTKNNNTRLVGLSFRMPENVIAPVVYMESFYDKIRQGEPMEQIMECIAECIEQSVKVQAGQEVLDMGDYQSAADRLTVAVVNTKENLAMLSKMPHEEIEDLSMVCRITLQPEDGGLNGSIRVTNETLEWWGVTKEQLFEKAKENTLRNFPPELYSIEVLAGQLESGENLLQEGKTLSESKCPMYVLTNRLKSYGAGLLAFPQALERVDQLFPEGYYLLPSSIHELIVVPKGGDVSPLELGKMVREVNRTCVSREEFLSDRVYEYDREAGKIRQIPEALEKRRDRER